MRKTMMTLAKMCGKVVEELIKKYQKKLLTIVHKDVNINIVVDEKYNLKSSQ